MLAKINIDTAFTLWRIGSILLYAAAVLVLVAGVKPRRPLLFFAWSLALAGFWHSIQLGQVYVPLLALAVSAWISLRQGRPWLAAISLGLLAALKPNFLVWPGLLALRGERRSGFGGLAVFASLTAVSALLQGPGLYADWRRTLPTLDQTAAGMAHIGGNSSLIALSGRVGIGEAGPLLAVLLAGGLALIAVRRVASIAELSALGICGTLLLGPVTWVGYSILLLPVFAWLRWNRMTVLAAAALCVPYWAVLQLGDVDSLSRQAGESVYAIALLLLLTQLLLPVVQRLREGMAEPHPAPARSLAVSKVGWLAALIACVKVVSDIVTGGGLG
jgi:hypothetical protein